MTAIGKLEESIYGVDDDEMNLFIYFFLVIGSSGRMSYGTSVVP